MAILGFADLKNMALPSLWDATEITKARLAKGASFEELLADVRAGLQMVNAQLLSMPHYAGLFAVQDTPEVEYHVGVSNGFKEATEYGSPDPGRGATTGHILPLIPYDRGIGWTMMYLRKAREAALDADIRSGVTDANDLWQKKLLTRQFRMEGVTVGSTSNASVPFADGGDNSGGQVDSSYVPPNSPEGETFTATHDHYLGYGDDAGLTQDTFDLSGIEVAAEHLQEHGHKAPFEMVASKTDAGDWAGVTGYKAPEWPGIVYHASAVERAAIPEISNYFGYVETDYGIVRLWLTPRVPTKHYSLFKTYGPGDPRNPLRVRIDPNVGFGYNLVPGMWVNAPAQMAVLWIEFGVGVGEDRTNGVCIDLAASSYSTPTIS